jgi:hypothetical protein
MAWHGVARFTHDLRLADASRRPADHAADGQDDEHLQKNATDSSVGVIKSAREVSFAAAAVNSLVLPILLNLFVVLLQRTGILVTLRF